MTSRVARGPGRQNARNHPFELLLQNAGFEALVSQLMAESQGLITPHPEQARPTQYFLEPPSRLCVQLFLMSEYP